MTGPSLIVRCVCIIAICNIQAGLLTSSKGKKRFLAAKRNAAVSMKNSKQILNINEGKIANTDKLLIVEHKAETEGVRNDKEAMKRLEKQNTVVLEGDIAIKKGSEIESLINGRKLKSSKRELLKNAKWLVTTKSVGSEEQTTVVIPYVLDPSLDDDGKQAFNDAVKDYSMLTCVNFQERTDEKDYVNFKKDSGCWSYVGRQGGKQDVSIGEGCQFKGTVLHEILHMLGFFHEHTRPDRDQYITVNYANIDPNAVDNFNKYDHNLVNDFDASYDYLSIMHYNQYAFATSMNAKTIESKDPSVPDSDLGQRQGLSETDAKQINAAYCHVAAAPTTTPTTTTTTTTTAITRETTITTTETTTETPIPTEEPFTISTLVPGGEDGGSPTKPITLIPGETPTTTISPNEKSATRATTTTTSTTTATPETECQQPHPCWPQDYSWSNSGYPSSCLCNKNGTSSGNSDKSDFCQRCQCLNVKTSKTSKAWTDNYLCVRRRKINPEINLSSEHGSQPGKQCIPFAGSSAWKDTKLCFNKEAIPSSKLRWSDENQNDLHGKSKCIQINEPNDWSWKQKFLCDDRE